MHSPPVRRLGKAYDYHYLSILKVFKYCLSIVINRRAAASVGVCTVPAVPTQGVIPKEGRC